MRRAVFGAAFGAVATAWATSPAQAAEPTVAFVVARADTLIGLSSQVLVSPAAWREVARLNHLHNPNRILPGQVLMIPTRLMRSTAVGARLISAVGDVQAGDAPAPTGTVLAEGQSLQTGPASSAVLELADGSRLQLPPSSLLQVAASRVYGARGAAPGATRAADASVSNASGGWFAGTMRVLRGSVEVFATKVLRARPLEVVTPTAVVGVRGTQYRVGLDAGAESLTHSEVIDGAVRFDAASGAAGTELPSGFGASISAGASAPTVAKLLAAPDLSAVPAHFDKPLVRFALPAQTTPLRVQVASDSAFEKVVSDQRIETGADVRIAGLADAPWHLRVRRIDAQGIEGYDATRSFVLKARPTPPAYRAPRSGAKQAVGSVEFAWAPNDAAPHVHLQVAEDAAFTRVVQDRDHLTGTTLRIDMPTAGSYFWRLGSVRDDGDAGPFGDAQPFELRPMPAPPAGGRSADGSALVFTWSGRPQDRQQVQLARDAAFRQITAQAELTSSEWTLPLPSQSGRYYFRYRSVEPDGFVSPYSDTLRVDVPHDWSGLWLLLPAAVLLF
ncbi:MAG: FecR domain-containing protein [Burkholderiales bacterium]|nr:FecR domain-containing protein [Burkholderiales bacterium]